jgi:translation initiation factor 2 alpha subunit (eIF-2alpha)
MSKNDNESYNYYTKEYPDENDIILVKLTDIQENGVYGKCIDYPKLEIFLVTTEITKRKVHLTKFFSPDKIYPMVVLNVNKNCDSIDVSYKKINEAQRLKTVELFECYNKIYDLGREIMDFYDMVCDDINLESIISKKELFKLIVQERLDKFKTSLLGSEEKNLVESIKEYHLEFLENPETIFDPVKVIHKNDTLDLFVVKYIEDIKKRLYISDIVACCDFTLIVLTSDAVTNIKKILSTNFNISVNNPDVVCDVFYIASPNYRLQVKAKNKSLAFNALTEMCKILEENSKQFNGTLNNPNKFSIIKEKQYTLSNLNTEG